MLSGEQPVLTFVDAAEIRPRPLSSPRGVPKISSGAVVATAGCASESCAALQRDVGGPRGCGSKCMTRSPALNARLQRTAGGVLQDLKVHHVRLVLGGLGPQCHVHGSLERLNRPALLRMREVRLLKRNLLLHLCNHLVIIEQAICRNPHRPQLSCLACCSASQTLGCSSTSSSSSS